LLYHCFVWISFGNCLITVDQPVPPTVECTPWRPSGVHGSGFLVLIYTVVFLWFFALRRGANRNANDSGSRLLDLEGWSIWCKHIRNIFYFLLHGRSHTGHTLHHSITSWPIPTHPTMQTELSTHLLTNFIQLDTQVTLTVFSITYSWCYHEAVYYQSLTHSSPSVTDWFTDWLSQGWVRIFVCVCACARKGAGKHVGLYCDIDF
jgi:hypothetical protein